MRATMVTRSNKNTTLTSPRQNTVRFSLPLLAHDVRLSCPQKFSDHLNPNSRRHLYFLGVKDGNKRPNKNLGLFQTTK